MFTTIAFADFELERGNAIAIIRGACRGLCGVYVTPQRAVKGAITVTVKQLSRSLWSAAVAVIVTQTTWICPVSLRPRWQRRSWHCHYRTFVAPYRSTNTVWLANTCDCPRAALQYAIEMINTLQSMTSLTYTIAGYMIVNASHDSFRFFACDFIQVLLG